MGKHGCPERSTQTTRYALVRRSVDIVVMSHDSVCSYIPPQRWAERGPPHDPLVAPRTSHTIPYVHIIQGVGGWALGFVDDEGARPTCPPRAADAPTRRDCSAPSRDAARCYWHEVIVVVASLLSTHNLGCWRNSDYALVRRSVGIVVMSHDTVCSCIPPQRWAERGPIAQRCGGERSSRPLEFVDEWHETARPTCSMRAAERQLGAVRRRGAMLSAAARCCCCCLPRSLSTHAPLAFLPRTQPC